MILRPATAGEALALSALAVRSKGHWGYEATFLDRASAQLAVSEDDIERGRVTVAERDGTAAGFALVLLDSEPPELDMLFVDPPSIGTGVGHALLAAAVEQARAAGATWLLIESDPNAVAFYRSHGAERVGSRSSAATGRELPLLRLAT